MGSIIRYLVCHFGAGWSAWWYGRFGAALTRPAGNYVQSLNTHLWLTLFPFFRLVHRWLWTYHFFVTYVDDSLAMVPRRCEKEHACLLLALCSIIGLPLSLHKFRLAVESLGRNSSHV